MENTDLNNVTRESFEDFLTTEQSVIRIDQDNRVSTPHVWNIQEPSDRISSWVSQRAEEMQSNLNRQQEYERVTRELASYYDEANVNTGNQVYSEGLRAQINSNSRYVYTDITQETLYSNPREWVMYTGLAGWDNMNNMIRKEYKKNIDYLVNNLSWIDEIFDRK